MTILARPASPRPHQPLIARTRMSTQEQDAHSDSGARQMSVPLPLGQTAVNAPGRRPPPRLSTADQTAPSASTSWQRVPSPSGATATRRGPPPPAGSMPWPKAPKGSMLSAAVNVGRWEGRADIQTCACSRLRTPLTVRLRPRRARRSGADQAAWASPRSSISGARRGARTRASTTSTGAVGVS